MDKTVAPSVASDVETNALQQYQNLAALGYFGYGGGHTKGAGKMKGAGSTQGVVGTFFICDLLYGGTVHFIGGFWSQAGERRIGRRLRRWVMHQTRI